MGKEFLRFDLLLNRGVVGKAIIEWVVIPNVPFLMKKQFQLIILVQILLYENDFFMFVRLDIDEALVALRIFVATAAFEELRRVARCFKRIKLIDPEALGTDHSFNIRFARG